MILNSGNKILLSHRRLYNDDHLRFFVGSVIDYDQGIVKITGQSWVRDNYDGTFHAKNSVMTKIYSLGAGTMITYLLPLDTDFENIQFENRNNGEIWLTDGGDLELNLTETKKGQAASKMVGSEV